LQPCNVDGSTNMFYFQAAESLKTEGMKFVQFLSCYNAATPKKRGEEMKKCSLKTFSFYLIALAKSGLITTE
jgi:hypothetical protein